MRINMPVTPVEAPFPDNTPAILGRINAEFKRALMLAWASFTGAY